MGKCIASKYMPAETTVCATCYHRHVCGDKDYLTNDVCCNFVDEVLVVVLPFKADIKAIFEPIFAVIKKEVSK